MKKLFAVFVGLGLLAGMSFSQSVDEILSKYFENIGGLDNWKTLSSLKLSGTIPTPQGEFPFTIYKKTPNLMKVEADINGQLMVLQAFDGEIGWSLNPFMGSSSPQKMSEEMAKDIKDEAIFEDSFIDYKEKGHEVSLEGKEELNGIECFRIKLVKNKNSEKDDIEQTYFIDTEYYMPIMVKSISRMGPNPGQELDTYLSNYEEVEGGLVMPFLIEVKMQGQILQTIKIDTVEVNSEIDDKLFKFPIDDKEETVDTDEEMEE